MTPQEFVIKVTLLYNSNSGIFSTKINAEELIPVGLDNLHKALFIFYVLQLDYAMKSQILYRGANRLYREKENFFTPDYLSIQTEDQLSKIIKEYLHPRYINEAVKRYIQNTYTLIHQYDGNPLNLFDNTESCMEVLGRLKSFRGFGPKIGNFFVRTMINTFNYQYNDIDLMLPPVDVHDVRIAYLMGFTDTDQMTQKNINNVKNIWSKACIDTSNSWLIFDKALWLLGSEGKPKTYEEVLKLLD
ncbi:hypothetical protein A2V49_04765 [candidate division WWE3 bacterium RBG_19FT_COMBO_34_6]|uniref:HhH-GPD domain-containing protein n=1 Tax=candidate division WWE3 bacterium RBG_19FT_COMBO_34_6 TaxID=1802612 RepID=A0A1F4UL33_UNCKA|nr:MAG: hypothetical protein A2V49_04765 [candidate division WWE3 bacterium RBG_19FT_COMBO_34_6]